MNFLWPTAWALAALALPITLLYLIRSRLERKPVSTLLFWEQIAPQVSNQPLWRKLRRWISLALQLLFLLLLVFALSRPLASWESMRPASVVIVLDASPSMGATDVPPSRWEQALQAARRRVARLRFFDTALLIEAGETPRVLHGWSRNRRALQRALDTARLAAPARDATGGEPGCDLRPALALAHHLGENRKNTEILLFTDGVWETPPAPGEMEKVRSVRFGSKPVNAGLTLFTARRSPAAPGEYQLLAQAFSDIPAELELRRNGQLIDVVPVEPTAPGKAEPKGAKPWQKSWEGSAPGALHFEARLRPTGKNQGAPARDDLAADNRAQARLAALHPVPVEVVSPPHPFLLAALESLPLVQLQWTWPPERFEPKAASARDGLTLFYHCLPPPEFTGGAVLVIAPEGDGFWGKKNGAELDSALVSGFEREEPVMRFVSLENLRLGKALDYTPPPGATLFAESFGKPLVWGQWRSGEEKSTEGRRWMAFAFGLEDSDLIFRTAFPILIGNLVQSLQPPETETGSALPGPAETRLKSAPIPANAGKNAEPLTPLASWAAFPAWWWALLLGTAWLLGEWWLYSRRITE